MKNYFYAHISPFISFVNMHLYGHNHTPAHVLPLINIVSTADRQIFNLDEVFTEYFLNEFE